MYTNNSRVWKLYGIRGTGAVEKGHMQRGEETLEA